MPAPARFKPRRPRGLCAGRGWGTIKQSEPSKKRPLCQGLCPRRSLCRIPALQEVFYARTFCSCAVVLFIWRLCLGLWAAAGRTAARPADHGRLTGFARQHVAAGAVFLFAGVRGALAAVCGRGRPAAGTWLAAVFQKLRAIGRSQAKRRPMAPLGVLRAAGAAAFGLPAAHPHPAARRKRRADDRAVHLRRYAHAPGVHHLDRRTVELSAGLFYFARHAAGVPLFVRFGLFHLFVPGPAAAARLHAALGARAVRGIFFGLFAV